MAVMRVPAHSADVFGQPALAAAIQRRDAEPLAHVGELVRPVAAVAGIAVEQDHRGQARARGRLLRAQVLGVNARAFGPGEKKVEAFGVRRLELRRPQLDPRVQLVHLGQRSIPE